MPDNPSFLPFSPTSRGQGSFSAMDRPKGKKSAGPTMVDVAHHLLLAVLLLWVRSVSTELSVSVDDANASIDIFYNGILLFSQRGEGSGSPILSLGVGEAEFVNTIGNFVITDNVTDVTDLPAFEIKAESPDRLSITFSTDDQKSQVSFRLWEDDDKILGFDASVTVSEDMGFNRMFLRVFGEADERVYGAGEQYTYFNLKGRNFPIWTREQGIGRDGGIIANASNIVGGAGGDYHTTYWPQASFLSSRKYSMLLYNYEYLELRFEDETENTIYGHSSSLSGVFLTSSSIRDLLPRVATFLGRQPPLPDWILSGAVLAFENGSEEMMRHYSEAKDAGVSTSALWIQDWSGTTDNGFGHRVYWNWKWNETYYKEFDVLIDQLSDEGVFVMVYCNPYLIEGSEMFLEAEESGFFLRDSSGHTFLLDFGGFLGGTIDLFSEEARTWYSGQLRNNIIGLGIKGWMADFGEYTDIEMVSEAEESPEVLHNKFPALWAETNKKIVEDAGDEEVVYFMRSGALGSSRSQILTWAGDQNVDFSIGDGVASTIVAALSLGVSGMGVTHFDIGGFTTQWPALVRTEELLLRSAEYAVFTPVMRTHLGNKPDQNVQIYDSPELLSSFARLTKIHTRLFNYTKEVVRQNAEEGVPAQRPMFFHYENDSNTWDIQYQYMYGPDLIVAPVIHKEQTEVSLYIPEGDDASWICLWSVDDTSFTGPRTVTLLAPIGFPAVFYRLDSQFASLFRSITDDFGLAPP